MYLVIKNNGGDLDPIHIELQGASSKMTNGGSTIGHMGLGLKQGLVLAHKLGMRPVVASNDTKGKYLLRLHEHVLRPASADPIRVLYLRYIRELQDEEFDIFTDIEDVDPCVDQHRVLQEGRLWNAIDAFQKFNVTGDDDTNAVRKILAEFFANAYDADKNYEVRLSESMCLSVKNGVAVNLYIPDVLRPDMYKLLQNPERYFKFRVLDSIQLPIFCLNGVGSVYPKTEKDISRLFVSGVLVHCSKADNLKTVFDYDLNSRDLISSDRRLADYLKYRKELGLVLSKIKDEFIITSLICGILQGHAVFEEMSLCYVVLSQESRILWKNAVCAFYQTEKIALSCDDTYVDSVVEQMYAHVILRNVSRDLYSFFERLGILKSSQVFQSVEYEELPVGNLDVESRKLLERAKSIFYHFFPDSKKIPITILYSPLGEHESKLGMAGHTQETKYKEICIVTVFRHRFTHMNVRALLKILIHEYRHCVTEANDFTYKFIHAAEDTILDLINTHMKLHRMGALD